MFSDLEKQSSSSYVQNQEQSVRNQFVKKVFTILAIQLVITFGLVILSCEVESFKIWLYRNYYSISLMSCFVMIAFMIISMCKPYVFQQYPTNIIILVVFTLFEGLLLSSLTALFDPRIVYNAIIFTFAIVIALIIFASSSKHDFTSYQPYLWVACLCLCLFGFSLLWLPFGSSIYAAIGALIFSCYLVSDTQMIIGGKKNYEVSIDDYVYAALMLYLDVINLFLYILTLFANGDDRN